MKHLLVFLLVITAATKTCKSQPTGQLSTTNKKAQKAYYNALQYFDQNQFDEGFKQIAVAIKEDPNFVEAYTLEANAYLELKEWDKAIADFKKSFAINPNFFPSSYYDCAQAELMLARYDDAEKDFETFLQKKTRATSQMVIDNANQGIDNCKFAIYAMAHPIPFNPVSIGGGINSDSCEYFPNVTADDQTFLFTRNFQYKDPQNGVMRMSQEDFYVSYRDANGNWSHAQNMGSPINTPNNEGAPSLSADGRFLFFAACDDDYGGYGQGRQGYGSCDIFFTQKVNGQWTKPVNVGAPVNTSAWETQPSFSSDGKTLYFISNRRGGHGDSDIWMAVLGPDGKFGNPVNLGDKINTPGKEEAVFIHPDNQTLYFASDGHTGMGGLDLYVCHRDSSGNWGDPVNLGYPINTSADESGLIVSGSGQIAYFSSDKAGGAGCDDIYKFDLPKQDQPVPVTYMKGKVYNKKTSKPVGASFELIDLATGKTIIASASDPVNGEFLVCLPINHDYALEVNAAGFCPFSQTFQMKKSPDPNKPFRMDVPLVPIDTGSVFILHNIFFPTGKFDLSPESKAELDKFVTWMKANPNVKIEISGHTDNVGDKKSNMALSLNRAKSVYDYLVAGGIDASRMTYKGYGDTKPVVPNDSDEHRQMNRRTEFKITAVK